MTFLQFIALAALAWLWLATGMTVAWLIWRRTGNSGWVDATWTLTVGAAGLLAALSAALIVGPHLRQAVVALFAAHWAARLGTHIASRTTRITDDPRYAALIRNWGSDAGKQMFLLLQKQALVSIPLALAMLLAAWNPVPFRAGDVLAIVVLAIAIAGEGIADRQLARFRAAGRNDAPPFWISSVAGFVPTLKPSDVGFDFARIWQGQVAVAQSFGGVPLTVDVNVSASPNPSAP